MTDNMKLPLGMYMIYNPYQESHGAVAMLRGAMQKQNNLELAQPGIKWFYDKVKMENLGVPLL